MIDRDNYVLAIFLGNFGLGLLHTAFNFYYVKVFLNIYQVNEYWFNLAPLLFLFWNAINDPLFGYLQDVSGTWMKDRSKIFTYFGPFFVLSFLIPWFPWRSAGSPPYVEGLHLIVSLFFYDAFFSCIGVSWSALYSDSATQDHRKRVKGIKYAQLASLLSVNVIVIIEKASHSLENFAAFQFICVSIGIISLACLISTGRLGSSQSASRDPGGKLLDEDNSKSIDESDCRAAEQQSQMTWRGVLVLTKELLSSKNFRCCVFTNFLHICRSTAHMNFAAIATDILVPQSIMAKGSAQLSGFFAVCTLLPQILIITNDKLLLRRGAYRMFMYGCLASICSSALYFFSASPYVVILFMLIDSITVHATSPLFNILLSEVIEEDRARNARGHPLSSLIFSLNALITKPAISIAPVVIVYLLNRNGYEFYQKDQLRSKELQLCMSRVIFATPLLLGALELFVFRKYTLRHKHRMAALPI